MSEQVTLHSLDKRVGSLEQWRDEVPETTDLKIENAINGAVIKLLLWFAGLLTIQSLAERFLGL